MTNTANKLVWLRPQPIVPAPAQPAGLSLGRRLTLGGACLALIMVELSGQSLLPQLPAAVAPAVTVVEAAAPEAPIEVEAEPLRVQYVHVDLLNDTSSEASAPEAPIAAQATDEPALTPPPAEGLLLNNQLAYLRYRSQAAATETALAPEAKVDIADSINIQAQPDNLAPAPVVAPPIIALADTASAVVAQEPAAQSQAEVAAPPPQLPEAEANILAASPEQSPPAPEGLTFSLDSEAQLTVVAEDLAAAPSATLAASSADDLNIAALDADLAADADAADSDYVYMLDELQPERRGYYESLDFSGHLFSNKAANRFIIVDGKARAEQEALDETTVVEAITADGVILRTNGESVFVDITSRIN